MTRHRINQANASMNISQILLAAFIATLSLGTSLRAVDLPLELPLWEKSSPNYAIRQDVKEQVRADQARPGSPSGLSRVFSSISSPTYSIHRPLNPNGVGLVICPGGGFRVVCLGRGESAALWPRSFAAWLSDSNIIQD